MVNTTHELAFKEYRINMWEKTKTIPTLIDWIWEGDRMRNKEQVQEVSDQFTIGDLFHWSAQNGEFHINPNNVPEMG